MSFNTFGTLFSDFTFNAIVTRLVPEYFLYRLENIKIKFLRHQPQIAFRYSEILIDILTKDLHRAAAFIN